MPKLADQEWASVLLSQISSFPFLIFAGLVKNAGKTTALNAINILFKDECLGLTSIGYDGEAFDAIYRHPKPAILVRPGQHILTTERFLPDRQTGYDLLEAWGNHPQFGCWLILKITSPGDFRMAGPSALSELQDGISRLTNHGASRIHVDGALNRLSHSSLSFANTKQELPFETFKELKKPEGVEGAHYKYIGVILSTGAALGFSLNEVTQRTLHILELFQLPSYSSCLSTFPCSNKQLPVHHNAYLHEGNWFTLPSFLLNQDLKSLIPPQTEAVYLKGALTEYLYLSLRTVGRLPRQFIIQTPAHILLSSSVWNGLKSRGIRVMLMERPQLGMLTLNPWHPTTPISTERIAEALLHYSTVPMVDIHRQQVWLT